MNTENDPPVTQSETARAERAARAKKTMSTVYTLLNWFYGLVAVAALIGQTGAGMHYLGWDWYVVAPIAFGLEFGGIALNAFANARRQLAERAVLARIGSAAVAAFAVWFNLIGHGTSTNQRITGALFAFFTALGYTLWLFTSAARRRDTLREYDELPEQPPVYGAWQWLRHPWITARAREMAKANPSLGLFKSLDQAAQTMRREKRNAALSAALRKRIKAATDPTMAHIAILTYDMDEVAVRLRDAADYDGLTGLLAQELTAERIGGGVLAGKPERSALSNGASTRRAVERSDDAAGELPMTEAPLRIEATVEAATAPLHRVLADEVTEAEGNGGDVDRDVTQTADAPRKLGARELGDAFDEMSVPVQHPTAGADEPGTEPVVQAAEPVDEPTRALPEREQRERVDAAEVEPARVRESAPARHLATAPARPVSPAPVSGSAVPAERRVTARAAVPNQDLPMKARAFALLDEEVTSDDARSPQDLAALLVDELGASKGTALRYERDWRTQVAAGQRPNAKARRLRVVPPNPRTGR